MQCSGSLLYLNRIWENLILVVSRFRHFLKNLLRNEDLAQKIHFCALYPTKASRKPVIV